MEVCYTLSFVLIFFNIVYAKLYYINEVCKFKTSTSLYCEWVNEGIYVLREQSPNYNYVEHIEFDRLQNSIVDANGFKKLKTISFPMSQFDTTRQLCDHIRRQRQRVTLYEGTISVSCVSIPTACRCTGLRTPCHMPINNYCVSMLQRSSAHY